MTFKYFSCSALCLALGVSLGQVSVAADKTGYESFPDKPVKLVVSVPPGGASDFVARTVGEVLAKELGQTVLIDNRAGASGTIATGYVARSAPDGYTLLNSSFTTHGVGPYFYKVPYDPFKDFTAVGSMVEFPLILAVNANLPVKSIKDLVALAKERNGQLSFASAGTGSAPHMAGELFKNEAKVQILHVPYKGSAPAAADVAGGQVDMMFDGAPSLLPFIQSGKLRPIAAVSVKRNALLPDVPTFAEAGYPSVVATLWYGVMAPAATPKPVIDRLNKALNNALANPDVKKTLEARGAEVVRSTPEEFDAFVKKDHARWGEVIKQGNIPTGK